jgi:hypothetical protein
VEEEASGGGQRVGRASEIGKWNFNSSVACHYEQSEPLCIPVTAFVHFDLDSGHFSTVATLPSMLKPSVILSRNKYCCKSMY